MPESFLDSRAILAAEIAESVRPELRAKQSPVQFGAILEKSLLGEARRAERVKNAVEMSVRQRARRLRPRARIPDS